ncbi:hypothetical protein B0H16DRAFT_1477196 [Mycena metata]|uniref:Uncharacterized protein n=1 Tax=Mycena metata TaxID=1033252 RepID=A0AAD7HAF9_9AGAR|nr:hypothetical protein B0H16DRAFT_1477196 [Mycena metata]
MSSGDFMELAPALRPHFKAWLGQNQPPIFTAYVCQYDSWRRRLPTGVREKAPLLKVLPTELVEQKTDDDNSERRVFLPTRWTAADSEDPDVHAQLQDPSLNQETANDRTHRDELIALIETTSGFSVVKSRLQFESSQSDIRYQCIALEGRRWQASATFILGMNTVAVFTGGTGPVSGTPSRAVAVSASKNKRAGKGGKLAVHTRSSTAVDGRRRVGEVCLKQYSSVLGTLARMWFRSSVCTDICVSSLI